MRRLVLWSLPLWVVLGAAGCGSPTVNVLEPFAVIDWTPHDGANCIATDWTLGACMNRDVDAASLTHVTVREVAADGTLSTSAEKTTPSLSASDAACIQIKPAGLKDGTEYAIDLDKDLAAQDGTKLGHELVSHFYTATASCP